MRSPSLQGRQVTHVDRVVLMHIVDIRRRHVMPGKMLDIATRIEVPFEAIDDDLCTLVTNHCLSV